MLINKKVFILSALYKRGPFLAAKVARFAEMCNSLQENLVYCQRLLQGSKNGPIFNTLVPDI